jgi:hypothetical protein
MSGVGKRGLREHETFHLLVFYVNSDIVVVQKVNANIFDQRRVCEQPSISKRDAERVSQISSICVRMEQGGSRKG